MTAAVIDPCDGPAGKLIAGCGVKNKVDETVGKVADKASSVIEFGKDPLGFIAQKEADAAKDLTENVIPALTQLTQPDLSAEWFLDAYKISFAAAILGWVMIVLWDLATFRPRGESGQEVADSILKWTPVFIGGSMFGPAIGAFLVSGIGALNGALVNWGLSATADEVVTEFNALIGDDPGKFLGGSFMAMIIFGALVLALLLVFLVLIVMMVTLYMSGVVLPLSLMWATKVGQREKGRKVVMVWVGILCSQPLIFLLLGFAFSGASESMMDVLKNSSSTDPQKAASLENLVQILFVIILLVLATLGPTTLASYAPVGPTDAAPSGPGVNARQAGGARGGAGPDSPTSSQTSQIAQKNAAERSAGKTAASSTSGAAQGTTTAGAAAASGGTLVAAKAAQEGGEGLADAAQGAKDAAQESQGGSSSSDQGGSGQQDAESDSSGLAGSGQSLDAKGGLSADGGDSGNDSSDGGQDAGQGGLAAKASDGGGDGGRSRGEGGSSLQGLQGAGKSAGRIAGKGLALAQQAGDLAEDQMDHHRDAPRGRR